jgi:hypothetical protein
VTDDVAEDSPAAEVELPRGLALNSVRIACPGEHLVTRFVKPHDYSREWRRRLEARIGRPVFGGVEFVYASGEVDDPAGGVTTVGCDAESGELCVFALRQALVEHAGARGVEAWVNRFREVTIAGLLPTRSVGEVIVEPQLVMRILREGFDDEQTFLVARQRVRTYLAGSLATIARPAELIGETAHRVRGDGPARATIVEVDPGGEVKLVTRRGDESSWAADDYSVVATPELIRIRNGPQAWANVQVAIGTLTPNKRRNTYAVKDRFVAAAEGLTRLGSRLALPGDAVAVVEREWSEVRVEERQ